MSLIGKKPITVPTGVEITIDGQHIKIKGPKGTLEYTFSPLINVLNQDGQLTVKQKVASPESSRFHGLVRALINNMIVGVSEGFEKRLEIIGVGYRAQPSDGKVVLNLGYSHPIEYTAPEGIHFEMDKKNKNVMIISGINKQLVGEAAANIRKFRPPEPYKGKGIRYVGEKIHRKAGKAAAKASA